MNAENFDLFLVLIKLKSYLISLIDEPETGCNNMELTREYLDRRYPHKTDMIIELLKQNGINSDCDIVFDESIHEKFKMIAYSNQQIDLLKLLEKFEIESANLAENSIRTERDEKLREIIRLLFKLVKIWNSRKEIDEDVEDYSLLLEEEVLRPEEELHLMNLDKITSISFDAITALTKKYIELFIDYYFSYGGDISLKRFINEIHMIKKLVTRRYYELFKKHGLEEKWLNKLTNEFNDD